MGQQSRAPGVLRARVQRLLRHLYPGFAARGDRYGLLSMISMTYVLGIIATGVYLVVPLSLLPALRAHPWRTSVLLLAFIWATGACLVSYLLTACADAGRIPDSWRPRPDGLHAPEPNNPPAKLAPPPPKPPVPPAPPATSAAAMLGPDGAPRYCAKCRIFKPDRAHHCSSCARCVLVMDHHCPFTGNACIGFMNRKFFVLFLYYAAAACTMVSFITPSAILGYLERMDAEVGTRDVLWIISVIFGYMLCFVHALALSGFSAFHTYLVLKNRTTIENNEPRQVLHGEALRRLDQTGWQHWCAVMGRRPLLWFVPVSLGCEGDGVNWRRLDDVL